jgi:hypothetical protein
MLEFLWEFRQQREILDAQLQANRAASDARESRSKTGDHQSRLDTMALTVMAMWSIMQERFGVTEAQLVERMQAIDLSDGKLDGKVGPVNSSRCARCRRQMSTRYKRCIYCGGESLDIRPFAGL